VRVIVTGSRRWSDDTAIYDALQAVHVEHGPCQLIHGDCSTGADFYARHWYQLVGRLLGWTEQRYPANWAGGPQAGPERNRRMIEAGADLVLAFPLPEGSGTQHTMRLAREAGIEVRRYEA
jgi:hypothetical protein